MAIQVLNSITPDLAHARLGVATISCQDNIDNFDKIRCFLHKEPEIGPEIEPEIELSKLFRNVPFLTHERMSLS
jgi:hypothetical protein